MGCMKLKVSHCLVVFVLLSITLVAKAQSAPTLKNLLSDFEKATGYSGAVLVADHGGIVYQSGVGFADRSWNTPNGQDTRFLIASLTKPMTAVLVLQLSEEGRLNLDDTIRDHLPDYPAEYSTEVTISQMLKHESGIPNFTELPGWFDGQFLPSMSAQEFSASIARLQLNFTPGTNQKYSNSNYFLLGRIIETVTQQSYVERLSEMVINPLKMSDSGVVTANVQLVPALARNYRRTGKGDYEKGGRVNIEHFLASASNYSTVGDLYRWTAGLLGGTLLNESSLSQMFNAQDPIAWNIAQIPLAPEAEKSTVITYNGELEGYTSMITMIPKYQLVVVLLNNNGVGYEALVELTQKILRNQLSPRS